MKSNQTLILEELMKNHINDSYNSYFGINFEDIPTSRDYKKLEKTISQALTDRYTKIFASYGSMGVDVEMYVSDDDDIFIEDAIQELTLSIIFDDDISLSAREILKTINKYMKAYPTFKYSKIDNSFWFTVDNYHDVINIIDTIQKTDKVNLGRLYYVYNESEVETIYKTKMNDGREERDFMERDFNIRRL